MRVVKAFGPGDLRAVSAPDPEPGEGQVLLAVRASGICGSDKWYWRVPGPVEAVAGHEVAGEVVALGPGVRHLRVGNRVAVNNVVGCGTCPECRAGRFVRCPRRPGRDVDNGFSELVVAPERNCLVLHPSLDYEAGCLIFDNWGTPFAAVERAGVEEGDEVVVTGCGPIGLAAVALAKLRGARVVALDPIEYRREAALRLGAHAAFAPEEGAIAALRALQGGAGPNVVIECSGKASAYAIGLGSLRIGGTLVCAGEGAYLELRPSDLLIRNHLNLLGTWYSTMPQGRAVQELMVQGRIQASAFVTHRVSLDETHRAFKRVVECAEGVLKTVILHPGGKA